MPGWVPKAGMPAHFNLADEFVALATGDDQWSWLTPWAWVLGVPFYETSAFCAQGPGPPVLQIGLGDFVTPTIGQGALWDKIARIYRDRVFGAFCEMPSPDGWTEFVCHTCVSGAPGVTNIDVIGRTPAGASHFKWYSTLWSSPTDGNLAVCANIDGSGGTRFNMFPGQDSGTIGPETRPEAVVPGDYILSNFQSRGAAGTIMTFCWAVDGATGLSHTPTLQPPVIGALEPTSRVYGSIADLGVELDHQEDKLDQLRQSLAFLIQQQASPSLAPDAVEPGPDLPAAPPVDIPPGAIAAVVTVASIPASSNVELLNPQRYSRVGRITLGTSDGWLPSMAIEHNPQLIVPLPPWAKLVRVSVYPPATATVRFLTKL